RAVHVHQVVQRIVQRAQVWADLLREVAGKEAELLPGLHRGAAENDPLHPPLDQRGHRHRHGQIGLAGAGGPDPEDDVVLADRVDVRLLVETLGRDGTVPVRDIDGVEEDVLEVRVRVREQHLARLLHVLEPQRILALDQLGQASQQFLGERDLRRLTGDEEDVPALSDMDPEPLLDQLEVLAPPAGERPCTIVVQQLQSRGRFCQFHLAALWGLANDLIKRRQQNKPLSSTSIVIGLFPRIAQIVLAHELTLDQRAERRRILAVLGPVHLQGALQPRQLVPRDQPRDRSTPRRALGPGGAEARRDRADQQQRRAEEREGERQADERSSPGQGLAPALADPLAQHLDGTDRNRLQVLPPDQLVQGLEGLELAQTRDVENLLDVLA